MAISVTVWNANQYPLTLSVNRGSQFAVNAVNSSTWAPGTTNPGQGPGWDNGGASPNNLGPGPNYVAVSLGSGQFSNISMNLPNTNPSSVQLYLFPQSGGSVAWYVLYSGMVVANGT